MARCNSVLYHVVAFDITVTFLQPCALMFRDIIIIIIIITVAYKV